MTDSPHIFLGSAAHSVDERWSWVRNVVTTRDLFTEVARLAGWTVTRFLGSREPAGAPPDGEGVCCGQSIVVMKPTA